MFEEDLVVVVVAVAVVVVVVVVVVVTLGKSLQYVTDKI